MAHVGIDLVQTSDVEYPRNVHEIERLPALGIYRLVQSDSIPEIQVGQLSSETSLAYHTSQTTELSFSWIWNSIWVVIQLDHYFPYRNGLFLLYEGPLEDEEEIRRWLMDEDVLMIPGHVEEVNVPLLTYLYETDDDIVVFFYEVR